MDHGFCSVSWYRMEIGGGRRASAVVCLTISTLCASCSPQIPARRTSDEGAAAPLAPTPQQRDVVEAGSCAIHKLDSYIDIECRRTRRRDALTQLLAVVEVDVVGELPGDGLLTGELHGVSTEQAISFLLGEIDYRLY